MAVMLCMGVALCGVLMGATIQEYAVMTVLAAFCQFMIICITILRAPKVRPELYERSPFKLGPFFLPFFSIVAILQCVFFEYVGVTASPRSGLVYLVLLIPGVVYYALRKQHLLKQGISVDDMVKRDLLKLKLLERLS